MHRLTRRPRRADDGFTLIELVITVSMLGIISAGLIGIVFQYLKVTTANRTRLSESTDQQFVSAYWQQDVSSLGRRVYDPDAADPVAPLQSVWVASPGPGGCGTSIAGGTVVVSFAWMEWPVAAADDEAWNSTAQEAAYVAVASGSEWTLKRVRCHGGSADTPQTVAHHLTKVPTAADVVCQPSCNPAGALPKRVSLTIDVANTADGSTTGYTTTLTADRRQG